MSTTAIQVEVSPDHIAKLTLNVPEKLGLGFVQSIW